MEHPREQDRVPPESVFVRFIVGLILLVLATQILLRFEGPRRLLNRSIRLEGEALSQAVEGLEQDAYPWLEWPPADSTAERLTWATLYLRPMGSSPEDAWVLVNGRAVKHLGEEGATVTVRDGDMVALYCPEGEVSFVISAATENLASPGLGTWAVGRGTVTLGVVRLR